MLNELGFHKFARILNMGDIEDNLGYYFSDKEEPLVRGLVEREYKNRFGLRHPVVAGLPTLGIWPAVSKERAISSVSRNLFRRDEKYRQARENLLKAIRAREVEDARLQIESDRANQLHRAAGSLGGSYMFGKAIEKS